MDNLLNFPLIKVQLIIITEVLYLFGDTQCMTPDFCSSVDRCQTICIQHADYHHADICMQYGAWVYCNIQYELYEGRYDFQIHITHTEYHNIIAKSSDIMSIN